MASRLLLNTSRTHLIRLYSSSTSSAVTSSTSGALPDNDSPKATEEKQDNNMSESQKIEKEAKKKAASMADADEALRLAMAGIDGGGIGAVEIEGGQLRGLKRNVKANMFRVI